MGIIFDKYLIDGKLFYFIWIKDIIIFYTLLTYWLIEPTFPECLGEALWLELGDNKVNKSDKILALIALAFQWRN